MKSLVFVYAQFGWMLVLCLRRGQWYGAMTSWRLVTVDTYSIPLGLMDVQRHDETRSNAVRMTYESGIDPLALFRTLCAV